MHEVEPTVYLVGRPQLAMDGLIAYLEAVGGREWVGCLDMETDSEALIEFMGRMCYRSWAPGLNPNVTKIRTDHTDYMTNILASGHGSVLEHANYSFVFHNVSRVFTHELVRHRAGVAVSQESMRYVRLTDIPFNHPAFVQEDPALLDVANDLLARSEEFLRLATDATGIEEPGVSFHKKKEITSAMRRYIPDGVATSIGWTANIRTIYHVLALRTAPGAEAEIRRVFDQVGKIMTTEAPAIFGNFIRDDEGVWKTPFPKV